MRAVLLLLCLPTVALAGDRAEADRLVAEGVAKGEAGDYPGAIERFMAAERAFPRPVHDCNIGLAWIGLKRPAVAWFFIDRCLQRAKEPLPAWVATQHAALGEVLKGDGYARLEVQSAPPGAALAVSCLEGAEPRAPVTLFVPRGPIEITARLDGFLPATRSLEVVGDATLSVALQRPAPAVAPPIGAPSAPPAVAPPSAAPPSAAPPSAAPPAASISVAPASVAPPARSSALAWTLIGVGAASALAGGYFLNAAFDEADAARRASRDGDRAGLDAATDATRLNEGLAYGSFALAAGLGVAAGLLLADDAPVALTPLGAGLGVRVRLP